MGEMELWPTVAWLKERLENEYLYCSFLLPSQFLLHFPLATLTGSQRERVIDVINRSQFLRVQSSVVKGGDQTGYLE